MKRIRLTPTLTEKIVASLRAGAFPEVAAEAWGVAKDTFNDWVRLGGEGDRRYVAFTADVRQASAQARLRAEMEMFKEQPRYWLQFGPGREAGDLPGWTSAVKPRPVSSREPNFLLSAEFRRLGRQLLEILSPWPDAREKAATMLYGVA